MLFNSHIFIFFFLPLVLSLYFLFNRLRLTLVAKAGLVTASLFFYGWWNIRYVPLIIGSILFNYVISGLIIAAEQKHRLAISRKAFLLLGLIANLGLLGYFKYRDFFIGTINTVFRSEMALLHVVLPLGISFFTITQIAYLVDTYEGKVKERDLINYALFVSFFPHLLAGPIIHHKEMMPQFASIKTKALNYRNLSIGFFLFSIGLFKKVIIADALSGYAKAGFDTAAALGFLEAWATSLSYTFQIYFDFSGYTDMALGIALMFNIRLPENFNSPYKAVNIQDFWKRWHITLSRFLKDYVYIPLGGNRSGNVATYRNLLLTFLIGGFWHGAGWTFVFWGFLHGMAILVHRVWQRLDLKMHTIPAWLITFNFINIAWVFFRAKDWNGAIKVLKGMSGSNSLQVAPSFQSTLNLFSGWTIQLDRYVYFPDSGVFAVVMLCATIILFLPKNSIWHHHNFQFSNFYKMSTIAAFLCSVSYINKTTEFLYFQF